MAHKNGTAINEAQYDVLWPLSRRGIEENDAAPRLADLNDKTICELWDGIFRGEIIFPLIRAHLQARFPRVTFVGHSEFGNFHGIHEHQVTAALPDKLRSAGADAAIVGIGA